jgi:hypothetical protein
MAVWPDALSCRVAGSPEGDDWFTGRRRKAGERSEAGLPDPSLKWSGSLGAFRRVVFGYLPAVPA